MRYDPAPTDTAIHAITVSPRSRTPDNGQLALDYTDYTLVLAAPPLPGGDVLSVGGLPSRRAFFRFVVPTRIIDSSTVLRATLFLTQRPNLAIDPRDTVAVVPELVLAGEEVTDLARAAFLASPFAIDTLRVAPGDSGVRQIEMAAAVRQWSAAGTTFGQQRAIILRSTVEGASAFELQFYSSEAAPAVRPRLRISYSLRSSFGIP